MSSYVAKKISGRVIGSQIQGMEPADPHYEQYEDHKGRQRKRKRAMPAGLSKRDERILVRLLFSISFPPFSPPPCTS
jgi:hypothetical protein